MPIIVLMICQMEGKFHIKHSVPALSELTDKVQAESDKTAIGSKSVGKTGLNLWGQ